MAYYYQINIIFCHSITRIHEIFKIHDKYTKKLRVTKYTKIHTRKLLITYTQYTIHENIKNSEL